MSEVSLEAAYGAYREYATGISLPALYESVRRGQAAQRGWRITHIYSLVDINETVQLFYCRDGNPEDLFTSPHVKDLALLWHDGKAYDAPAYVSHAYSEILRDAGEHEHAITTALAVRTGRSAPRLETEREHRERQEQQEQDAAEEKVQNYGTGLVIVGALLLLLATITTLVVFSSASDKAFWLFRVIPLWVPGIIYILVGRGLQSFRCRALGMLLAVPLLPVVPVGTIFAVYGLRALLTPTARRLFWRMAREAHRHPKATGDLDDLPCIARLDVKPWWHPW